MAGISDPSLQSIRRLRGAASPNTADIDWNEFCAFTVTSSWLKVVPKSKVHLNPLLSHLPQTGTIEVWPSIEAICADLDNRLEMFMRYVVSQYGGEGAQGPRRQE